jgi:hypothetical protein
MIKRTNNNIKFSRICNHNRTMQRFEIRNLKQGFEIGWIFQIGKGKGNRK